MPAVKMMEALGPQQVIAYARRFGLEAKLEPYLSLALGAADLTLIEMTSAYSVFPNGGVRMRPYPILKITDRDGNLLEEGRPEPQDAIRADTAFVMTNLLRGVVQRGTGGVGGQAWLAARRQDRHDRRLRRCVVHRLRSRHHRRRVGGPRRAQADRPQRNRRRRRAADLDRVHAAPTSSTRDPKNPPEFVAPGNIVFLPVNAANGDAAGEGATGINEAFISGTQPGTRLPALTVRLRREGAKAVPEDLCLASLAPSYSSSSAAGWPRVPEAFCIRYALMNGSRSPSSTRLGSPTSNFVRWSLTI